ncbi:MAG: PA2779 family protein [Bdellovibrionota bacterium]
MKLSKLFSTAIVTVLSFALVEVTFALNASNAVAGMIPTSTAVSDMARTQNREKVNAFLLRKDVQAEMLKRGVFPEEARQRVASLSDFELQNLAGRIDSAPAGADVIVISLTTILLVVIILLLLGRL